MVRAVTLNTSQFAVDNALHCLYFRLRKPHFLIAKDLLKQAQPFIAFTTFATRPTAHHSPPTLNEAHRHQAEQNRMTVRRALPLQAGMP